MTTAIIKPSFSGGELSPSLYGRVDLAKWHTGAATVRNMFVNYRGGVSSRPGSMFVGPSKQTGQPFPPRLLPFRFNIQQEYVLEFGNQYMRVISDGAYVTDISAAITGITQALPAVVSAPGHGFSNGDWVALSGIVGMSRLNGLTLIVQNTTTNTFTLIDIFGNVINSLTFPAYVSGGTVSRIYTLSLPYLASDLPLLKFAQSADVLTLCHQSYPPADLTRIAASNFTYVPTTFASSINAPASCSVSASNTTATASESTTYNFVVTAINSTTGEESQSSPIGTVTNSIDISSTIGSLNVDWSAVSGASNYNVYVAPAAVGATAVVPVGSLYGFAGSALGTGFVDSNITPDFTKTPPLHLNPFAQSDIIAANVTAGGSGYTQATVTATINTSTGSGAVLTPVVNGDALSAVIITNGGQNYSTSDTITISDSGTGSGATATLTVGPATGTFPGCVAYFQQRRVYASTLNNPDTYFMSQPGAFLNFDASPIVSEGDAITGSPWATQVNGIQAMIPMPGGLVILTGQGAWQLSGGSQGGPVTPSNQSAQPQAYNGCSPTVQPITINNDILYVQSKGSIVRDLAFNFFVNIYTGSDITMLSSHLFTNHQILEWAWAEEPFKVVWAVRNDGVMLSLTYLKDEQVTAWTRHDTNGQYVSVVSISEPPVDALYYATQRFVQGQWIYYVERADDRLWTNAEDAWCVDCGLSYPNPEPAGTLTASAATGSSVVFTSTAPVFTADMVGFVLRMGNGIATITQFLSSTQVIATITQAITATVPNDPGNTPFPAASGNWTLTQPTMTVSGLDHLEGLTVSILADGSVAPNQVVTNGTVPLPQAASKIVIGLPFQCQLQSLYLDVPGEATVQGKRKNIYAVTVRFELSRGAKVGVNQPDAAAQPYGAAKPWANLQQMPERTPLIPPGQPIPLVTGDERVLVPPGWAKTGQVAVQQDNPLPLNVLAWIPEFAPGDSNG